MRDESRGSFFDWARSTLAGHIVLLEIVVGIPALVVALGMNHLEGTLTPRLALEITSFVAISMLALAVISRYMLLPKLQKKFEKKP